MYRFKNALIIDDDYVSNFIADHLLTKHKVAENVSFSRNGDEALTYLREVSEFPELIFLDINMPVMDGFEFIEAFRKYNLDKFKTRIIIYTSSFSDRDIKMLQTVGFKDFIVKPLTEEKLNEMLKLFDSN